MKVLAIGAHPDDIELGCGGTLLKLIKQDAEVYHLLAATKCYPNEKGPYTERLEEQKVASAMMDVKKIYMAGEVDALVNGWQLIQCIEGVVSHVNPDLIFTHWRKDTHQDHVVVGNATLSACRRRGNILFYETPSTEDFLPTVFVDITDTMTQKLDLVNLYKSQVDRLNLSHYVKLMASSRAYHSHLGYNLVEGFIPYRMELSL